MVDSMHTKWIGKAAYILSVAILFMLLAGVVRTHVQSIPGYRVLLIFICFGVLSGWLLVKKASICDCFFANASHHKALLIVCAAVSALLTLCIAQCFYVANFKPLFYGDQAPRLFELLLERMPLGARGVRIVLLGALAAAAILSMYALTVASFCLAFHVYRQPRPDQGGYLRRLGRALLPCVLLSGLVFFFGPWEVFFQNPAEVDFVAIDFIPFMILLWAFSSIVLASLISAVPERFFHIAVSVVFGLAVCAYLQVLLLDPGLGNVNQTVVDWDRYRTYSLINAVIWLALLAVPIVMQARFPKLWAKGIPIVCALILGMQTASVVALSVQADPSVWTRRGGQGSYLTGDDQYVVGSDGNVLLICLDAFDNAYLNELAARDADALAFLHDFTYYDNYDCSNHSTQPSICCFLTGASYDPSITWDAWYQQAWRSDSSASFYGSLSDAGYRVGIYANAAEIGGAENMAGIADNVVTRSAACLVPDQERIWSGLTLLSLYRLCPFAAKMEVLKHIPEMNHTVSLGAAGKTDALQPPDVDNYAFYSKLEEAGLQTAAGKRFVFQYLHGVHEPIDTSADCRKQPDATREETIAGCLTLVRAYLEELKAVGVYDHSTVIITSDHGHWDCLQPIFLVKQAGQTHSALRVTSAPASHNELLATMLACIGREHSVLGPSAFDFHDGQLRQRDCWSLTISPDYPEAPKRGTVLTSIWNTYSRFTYTGDGSDLQKKITKGSSSPGDEVLPLAEAPW